MQGGLRGKMSAYFGIIGAIAVTLACLLLSGSYSAYIRRRVAEYSAYLDFLRFMRREISSSIPTTRELGFRSGDSVLEGIGFLPALREGALISEAFSRSKKESLMSEADREALGHYFSEFGLGTLNTELSSLDACIASFSERERAERSEAPRRIKLAATLLMLFAAALTVLLI